MRIDSSLPLDAAVKHIKECVRSAGVDVIALGSGDGIVETQLVEKIAADAKNDIRFYLLDISHPLLSTAFRHAEDTFASKRGVFVCAMHGNFFHLSRYPQLHYRPTQAHRRRLYTMLGFTFANLENERHFLQQSLSGAAEGDLLLVDLNLAQGAPDDVDTLRKKEPSLSNGALDDISTRWLSGPIRRYAEDVTQGRHVRPARSVLSDSWQLCTRVCGELPLGKDPAEGVRTPSRAQVSGGTAL
jgi:hypothetical protein